MKKAISLCSLNKQKFVDFSKLSTIGSNTSINWEIAMIEVNDKGGGLFIIKIIMKEVHTLDVPDLKEKLQGTIIDRGIKKMVVDLTDVKMITSSGIGIFLNINQSLKSQLRLASANEEVKKVLDLTKVTSVIKLYKSVDEALASF
jgi:anti-anti-sigma factor